MLRFVYFSSLFVIVISCSSTVKITKFTVPEKINEGEKVELFWATESADYVTIEGINGRFATSGSTIDVPDSTKTYTLYAHNKDGYTFESRTVKVIKSKKDKTYKSLDLSKIEKSTTSSKYLSGLLPIDSIEKNSKFKYEIFGFDRSNYPEELKFYVSVKDENGNFVANLAQPYGSSEISQKYFKELISNVTDDLNDESNQKGQKIDNFIVTEHHDDITNPYSFSLVLDHSGSMSGEPIRELQKSVRLFINKKSEDDELSAIKFDNIIHIEVPLTKNKNEIFRNYEFDSLDRFGRATALYAAADEGIYSLTTDNKNKNVILFTDGLDNTSFFFSLLNNLNYSFKPIQLIYKARERGIRIYTIGFGNVDKNTLEKIAILTDGKYFYTDNGNEIYQIYSSLPRMFYNYYTISYKPIKKDGWHNIVLNADNNLGNVTAAKGSTYIGEKIKSWVDDAIQPQGIAWFKFSSSDLEDIYIPNIELITNYMKKFPKSTIEVHGHTDLIGEEKMNMSLSLMRANRVCQELKKKGIDSKRIKAIAHGESQSIWNPQLYDWQAAENRRVEIVIID